MKPKHTLPTACIALLFLLPALAGCLGQEQPPSLEPEAGLFDFEQPRRSTHGITIPELLLCPGL